MKFTTRFASALFPIVTCMMGPAVSSAQSLIAPRTEIAANVPGASVSAAVLPFPAAMALPAASAVLPKSGVSVDQTAEHVARTEAAWRKRWLISLAPLVAAQSLDAASSYGMRELNPLLAGSNGGFGMKAMGIKFGAVGGFIAVESVMVRKHPRTAKLFTVLNWSAAGLTASFAAHNFNLQ